MSTEAEQAEAEQMGEAILDVVRCAVSRYLPSDASVEEVAANQAFAVMQALLTTARNGSGADIIEALGRAVGVLVGQLPLEAGNHIRLRLAVGLQQGYQAQRAEMEPRGRA